MPFEKVTRQQAKLRMALTGVSGSGKTLGALYVAYGITGDWNKIALIDTEHERARFYANRDDLEIPTGEFLYCPMYPPFSPSKYKQLVQEGAKAVGTDGVVIVDSFSHAWEGQGGVLDIKEKVSQRAGKNSYTAWNEAGQEQNALIDTILSVPAHTIITMRSKTEYTLEENEKGKKTPKKVGMRPVQRENTEYEFDIVLDIDRSHIAVASKDVTFLDKFGEVITPDLGKRLEKWLSFGEKSEVCEVCGRKIKPTSKHTVESLVAGTLERTGKKMCSACFNKWNTEQNGVDTTIHTAESADPDDHEHE